MNATVTTQPPRLAHNSGFNALNEALTKFANDINFRLDPSKPLKDNVGRMILMVQKQIFEGARQVGARHNTDAHPLTILDSASQRAAGVVEEATIRLTALKATSKVKVTRDDFNYLVQEAASIGLTEGAGISTSSPIVQNGMKLFANEFFKRNRKEMDIQLITGDFYPDEW